MNPSAKVEVYIVASIPPYSTVHNLSGHSPS